MTGAFTTSVENSDLDKLALVASRCLYSEDSDRLMSTVRYNNEFAGLVHGDSVMFDRGSKQMHVRKIKVGSVIMNEKKQANALSNEHHPSQYSACVCYLFVSCL
mmetsp:Transcript_46089/g.112570  ORF Transcript_46089/g.112570 Transcript_46089/m.112570 type:complete len:104 (-) Transcript_46089:1147-1458(-)